jgi:peptide/nickel transport system permease protein
VIVFAVNLRWLPALATIRDGQTSTEVLRSLAMPVLTLTCVVVAQMARLTRAALVNTLREPYIEMAILKGARPARVVLSHALPNAIGPVANAVALSLSSLLGGVVVVETIFNYPGLARLMVDAVSTRDIPVVQGCAMIFCAGYLLLVTIADVLAIVSNPRLRHR